jgi:hypothetical protein
MAAPQIAPLPPFFELSDGMVIKITAVDAATNATISAVVISQVSIDVDPVTADETTTEQLGQIFLIPGPAVAA